MQTQYLYRVVLYKLNIQLRMLSQSNYLCGIRPSEGSHLTTIIPPYELLMLRTPEPQMLRKGKIPTSLLKQKKNQRTELKLPILQWFTALTVEQRKKVTEIQDDVIVEMTVRLTGFRNLETIKVSVDFNKTRNEISLDQRFKIRMFGMRDVTNKKFQAQKSLIDSIRIICVGRPAIYLSTSFLQDPEKCINTLSQISQGKIFNHQSSQSSNGPSSNPLWFSCHSFNSIGQWVCSSLEQNIIRKYQLWMKQSRGFRTLHPESSALDFVAEFLKFWKKSLDEAEDKQKIPLNLQKWLQLGINQSNYTEIAQIKKKFQILEISFSDQKTKELFDNIDKMTSSRKRPKKVCKKRRADKKIQQSKPQSVQTPQFDEEVEESSCVLTHDISEIELVETIQAISVDVSTIQELTANQPQTIKKYSQQIYFPQQKLEQNSSQLVQVVEAEVSQEVPQEKTQENQNQHAISHSTSDSLQQKKKRKPNNKRSRRRIPEQLIQNMYSQWFETSLQSFVDNLSIQSNKLFEARIIAFERIRHFVMKLHGEYTVDAKLFGSCSVGLALPTSDIDILLTGFNLQTQADCVELLQKLSNQLKKMRWIVECSIYPSAKVPIIKIQVNPNIPFLSTFASDSQDFEKLQTIVENLQINKPIDQIISIDITVEAKKSQYSHLGFKSTDFMKTNLEEIQYLHPIVLTLKYLLAEKKLNKPYKGGLSSFGLLVLCSAYLKNYSQHQSLSEAFLNLLDFYGNIFDGQKQSIALYQNCPCFTQRPTSECVIESGLSIVDPLSGRVMTANCTGFYLIKYQFKRIFISILKVKQALKAQLKEMEINEFKSLKQGKKKSKDRFIKKYLQNYQIKQILNQEE